MAYPNEIMGGRWDSYLRRFFAIKQQRVAPEVASNIQPVIDIPTGVENEFLVGTRLYFGNASVVPVALENPRVVLTNPADSGVLVVLEAFAIATLTGAVNIFHFRNFTVGVSGTTGVSVRDTRLGEPVLVPSVAEFEQGTTPTPNPFPRLALTGANMLNMRWPLEIVLASPPGNTSHVVFEGSAVNTSLNMNLFWREIPIEETWSYG